MITLFFTLSLSLSHGGREKGGRRRGGEMGGREERA
jgi:hypothetical protein